MSFKTGVGVGVDARGDSGGDGVVDVEGVEGGRWTIVVRVMGNRGRNRLMVSVVVLCLFAVRQGDGAETVLGGDARRVGALKRRRLWWWRFWPAEGQTELIMRRWHDVELPQ